MSHPTQLTVTQEDIRKADNIECCQLMRKIIRGAEFLPDARTMDERLDAVVNRMTRVNARFHG
jgi:hypothetical protein